MKKTAARKTAAKKTAVKKTPAKKTAVAVSLGARLRAFIEFFATRRDVHVLRKSFLLPFTTRQSKKFIGVLPPELFAFSHEIDETEFCWVLAEEAARLAGFDEASRGGQLSLRSLKNFAYRAVEGWEPRASTMSGYATYDVMSAEGQTWIVQEKGKRPAEGALVFNDDNANKMSDMGSLEAYFTKGARRAFTWYWQVEDAEGAEILAQLLSRSVPRTTDPAVLLRMLVERGLAAPMAEAMMEWLGADVVVLLDQRDGSAG